MQILNNLFLSNNMVLAPLISVIVPIYNSEKFLRKCIESILRQSYRNIELILVNDGSSDNSLAICSYYKNLDNRVLVIDKDNSGVSASRNLGISVATGEYLGFVDADDHIDERMYEILLATLMRDKADVCVMMPYAIKKFEEKSDCNENIIEGSEALTRLILLEFPTSVWAYLYSKDILSNQTLNEEIHFFEDFEFNFRILLNANKVSLCDKNFYNYNSNEVGINHQEINYKRMTSLNIYDLLVQEFDLKRSKYFKYLVYFRAHCMISVILSIAKSRAVKDEYYKIARVVSGKMIVQIILSRYVSKKYKLTILSFLIFPKLFSKLLYYIKYKDN